MSQHRPSTGSARSLQGKTVAVAASRWNEEVVQRLLEGCISRLRELGAEPRVVRVPGAFELPLAARWLCETGTDAVICLGCVIRGETAHFEYVAGQCARGIMNVSLETQLPVIFGVLATETHDQAMARSGGAHGHAGVDAADAAAEMLALADSLMTGQEPVA